jgi:hypothetical protein
MLKHKGLRAWLSWLANGVLLLFGMWMLLSRHVPEYIAVRVLVAVAVFLVVVALIVRRLPNDRPPT